MHINKMFIKKIILLSTIIVVSGCASNEGLELQVSSLTQKVNKLTTEVSKLKMQQDKTNMKIAELKTSDEKTNQRIDNVTATYKK